MFRTDGQVIFVAINRSLNNVEEIQKIKENTVITVRYSGINDNNKLLQPVYLRKRIDTTWSDIVANSM